MKYITPPYDLAEIPEWLTPGARVLMVWAWPRVSLSAATMGTVKSLTTHPETGALTSFVVVWDDHWERGVQHYGFHAFEGHVVPVGKTDSETS